MRRYVFLLGLKILSSMSSSPLVPILRNILGLMGGLLVGMFVNMSLIQLGPKVMAYPEGYDSSNVETISQLISQLETHHFLWVILAHAMGTLLGAFVASRIAYSYKQAFALAIGFFFLLGGIMMVKIAGGPLWMKVADLGLAYIPMAILGWFLGRVYGRMPSGEDLVDPKHLNQG